MAATWARTRSEHTSRWARGAVGTTTGGSRRHTDVCPAIPGGPPCRCASPSTAPLFALAGDDGPLDAADQATFEDLYCAIGPRLHRFVRRAEPAEADDISAEVWLAVTRYLPRFRGDADGFEALVFTIARRRITDHRRRRTRRRTDVVANETLADVAGDEQPESEALDQLRTRATLEELVRTLSPAQVEVVMLRVVHGLPVERVAAMLGRSPGNVRILQHRALKRLRSS
jgi:RNA polymerase sigma-70 factor (ECF subfamily)